jgi:hypothetical protein
MQPDFIPQGLQHLSVMALVVSVISLVASSLLSMRTLRANIKPVVAVVYDGERGWIINNVGNGPALNIVVCQQLTGRRWVHPVRVPPMPVQGTFRLLWLENDNVHAIGVGYEDLHGKKYSSICANDLTTVRKGSGFPRWGENEIGRHWWKTPIRPTVQGEIAGEWRGN